MKNAESVKARLKNKAVKDGRTFQDLLIAYGLERTLYRISISPYKENFTLKGGIFLYALFGGNYERTTTDIDFLAERISNDENELKYVFSEIFRLDAEDPLYYDLNTLKAVRITEFKEYHGVNISITAFLDRTRIPVSIDIGFGDVIYPGRTIIAFPTVLSEESPELYSYSLSTSIAEKFEAIVSLAYDNSRFKDFYDIYVLAHSYDFSGRELQKAVEETFEHRHTALNDIAAFEEDYSDDAVRQSRWKAFVKKKKPLVQVSLADTLQLLKVFLGPISQGIQERVTFEMEWSCEQLMWMQLSQQ
ncbi:MAG: nucleotidyl transferase AbiEii/AbiGii toxin family protein [Lachnospiraceae bacterium]|nr:nucleotidyl transferase AbiEii/AbiGii toxin family protein [Lachnospiraceae bacterium]